MEGLIEWLQFWGAFIVFSAAFFAYAWRTVKRVITPKN